MTVALRWDWQDQHIYVIACYCRHTQALLQNLHRI